MFDAAIAYDEVRYKYTVLQSLVASCFATGQVLHKAYDEIIYKYMIYNFCRLLKNSSPSAKHRKTAC